MIGTRTRPHALSCLPARLAQQVWHAHEIGQPPVRAIPTGHPLLDAQLPGRGWPCQGLTEVLQPPHTHAEWRLLLPSLAPLLSAARPLMAIACPHEPHAPGLLQAGVPPSHLVWVRTPSLAQALWATEQAIKSLGPGAVLAWLPQAQAAHIRRLQAHALACDAPVFLMRPLAVQHTPSAAPLRVSLSLLGPWHLGLGILKRRGSPHEGLLALTSVPSRLHTVMPRPGLRSHMASSLPHHTALPPISPLTQQGEHAVAGPPSFALSAR